MTAVSFNAASFKTKYSQFADVSDQQLELYFDEATLYLSNSDDSPVQNIGRRELLLWMLTAHVATLNGALSVDGQAVGVGRIASAGKGSVNVSLDYGAQPGTDAWYNQTQFGASFLSATRNIRSCRYFPHPTRY